MDSPSDSPATHARLGQRSHRGPALHSGGVDKCSTPPMLELWAGAALLLFVGRLCWGALLSSQLDLHLFTSFMLVKSRNILTIQQESKDCVYIPAHLEVFEPFLLWACSYCWPCMLLPESERCSMFPAFPLGMSDTALFQVVVNTESRRYQTICSR